MLLQAELAAPCGSNRMMGLAPEAAEHRSQTDQEVPMEVDSMKIQELVVVLHRRMGTDCIEVEVLKVEQGVCPD